MTEEVDWTSVENEFRLGNPLRAIAEKYGVSYMTVSRRAKRDGWTKDLSARISAKAEALVAHKAVLREKVSKRAASDKEIVEVNAMSQAQVILQQRKDVQKARATVTKLFDQVDALVEQSSQHTAIEMPARIDAVKKLSDAMKTLIELERKVLRIRDDDPDHDLARGVSAIVRKVVDPRTNGA